MKVRVIDQHDGEGKFPAFRAGEVVHNAQPCGEYAHWMSCKIRGLDTFIPDTIVSKDTLLHGYDPTELVANEGDILVVEAIVFAWLYARNEEGVRGWIPAEKVTSIPQEEEPGSGPV